MGLASGGDFVGKAGDERAHGWQAGAHDADAYLDNGPDVGVDVFVCMVFFLFSQQFGLQNEVVYKD